MFTYGDGVSNVNLKKLILFHKKQKKLITVTAVRPPARFGEIVIKKKKRFYHLKRNLRSKKAG